MLDCIIVGGGIAGLQAAVQLGRYSDHKTLVIDSGKGRSTLCRTYHNILGWPDGVSGEKLRQLGRKQAVSFGVAFKHDRIIRAEALEKCFRLQGEQGETYEARTLLLATGVTDRMPDIPGLEPTLGRTVYICPDCDGYEIQNRKTVVMGSGESGADMTLLLYDRTKDLTYVNHERTPVSQDKIDELRNKGIDYREGAVAEVVTEGDGMISGFRLKDGTVLPAERGFISFGGNQVHSELAVQLGAEIEDNKHVKADARTRMTSVPNVWAAGDLGVHSELAAAAMGDAVIAAVWINKKLKALKNQSDS